MVLVAPGRGVAEIVDLAEALDADGDAFTHLEPSLPGVVEVHARCGVAAELVLQVRIDRECDTLRRKLDDRTEEQRVGAQGVGRELHTRKPTEGEPPALPRLDELEL